MIHAALANKQPHLAYSEMLSRSCERWNKEKCGNGVSFVKELFRIIRFLELAVLYWEVLSHNPC